MVRFYVTGDFQLNRSAVCIQFHFFHIIKTRKSSVICILMLLSLMSSTLDGKAGKTTVFEK